MTVRELLPPLSQPVSEHVGSDIVRRRRELGAFLKHRRSLLRAQDVGLPEGGRRHVRGLRREEVAQLAGISASWYTLLEQGRVPHVSGRTLNAVAEALQLSQAEHEHLQVLAQVERPVPLPGESSPSLAALISYTRNVRGAPTYLTTAQFEVLAWNPEADALFGFSEMPPRERNLLLRLLAYAETQEPASGASDEEFRRVQHATLNNMVGVLRANYGRAGDAAFDTFIEALRLQSREFRRLWREQSVALLPEPTCTLLLPDGDTVTMNLNALVPIGHPGHLLICLTPAQDSTASV